MISRFKSCILPVAALALVATLTGCAGSKSSSSSSNMDSASSEPARNEKLEDAKRSAEDAELKAHQLREEKNRSTAKSGN
jgi:NaMN:DMB phosphoribosyltransferase